MELLAQIAQIETATKFIDHAAAQDMRWWFLGLLVVGGAALWIVARYFAARHDRMSERLDKVQDSQGEYLKASNAQLVNVVADNSATMKQFSATFAAVQHLFEGKKTLVALIAAALCFTGCAETKLQLGDGKHPASFRTAADAARLHLVLTPGRAELDIDAPNHSAPTDARGRNITRAGDATAKVAGDVVMGIATKGAGKVLVR
ncbi:MAG TPA: hypothetical protein VGO11_19535 [Chthoniobacteraceae bacterium]|jgi:hypothetical protein|nr:hypothetical protein [Chthoniobacteraceae bacterium]